MFFFFNDTATTEIYTLSLHDALPISSRLALKTERKLRVFSPDAYVSVDYQKKYGVVVRRTGNLDSIREDRKSTRLNSSHANISYAVFCLKKKKNYYSLYPTSPTLTTH